jgi:RNA polymerase sigma-70 factor (ECF subfamily)
VGRSDLALNEVCGLLQAVGYGDVDAFAAFYDRTAPVVFNLLHHVLGDRAAAERATVRVYVRVWRTAPAFDPAVSSGGAFLIEAVHGQFEERERRGHSRTPGTSV